MTQLHKQRNHLCLLLNFMNEIGRGAHILPSRAVASKAEAWLQLRITITLGRHVRQTMGPQSHAHCRYQLGLRSISLGLISRVYNEFSVKMRRLMSARLYCSGSQTNNAGLLECFDCGQSRYIVEMFNRFAVPSRHLRARRAACKECSSITPAHL